MRHPRDKGGGLWPRQRGLKISDVSDSLRDTLEVASIEATPMNMIAPAFLAAGQQPFDETARAAFAAAYPRGACLMRHSLAHHPLLSLDALAEAASRLGPANVLRRPGDASLEAVRSLAEAPADIASLIRSIADANLWIGFKDLEQLPEYAEILGAVGASLEDLITPVTGLPRCLRAFIFISSPRVRFPFHADPEYNILAQIAGRKRFAVFPPEPPFLTPAQNETYHRTGRNGLAWDDAWASQGRIFDLGPGDALHHTFKAPHWVEVDDEPSISLSLTWCSDNSLEQNDAWSFNAWLRERGFDPRPPAPLPHGRSRLRANAWRVIRRLGLAG